MSFEPEAGPELDHVIEVIAEGLDAVDVGDDDQLAEPDEQVRPTGGVVIKQVDQISATLCQNFFFNFSSFVTDSI